MNNHYGHFVEVERPNVLAEKIVLIDGIEGCGKTMLSPIVASLDRVELLTYSYEIEYLCSLAYLDKIDSKSAGQTISLIADLKLYNLMQSREVNFRFSDLSSVFKANQPWRYLFRLFQSGDQDSVNKIRKLSPILLLTTHKLIAFGKPIFEEVKKGLVLIEVVRHPLYMIIQNVKNFENLIGGIRDFSIYINHLDKSVPFFVRGWEDKFVNSTPIDRAIYYIEFLTKLSDINRKKYSEPSNVCQVITIPFEQFVVNPAPFMSKIKNALGTKSTRHTDLMMKRQKVPRKKYADSIDLPIYRRCGWKPPMQFRSELEELEARRNEVSLIASSQALKVLDSLCDQYEIKYMQGKLRDKGLHYV